MRDGSERWIFIHIEVQGEYEGAFAKRMFAYNVAVWLLYNQTVVSLAVLCDDRPDWRPSSFNYGNWGYQTAASFGLAKLLDHAHDLAALEASKNPFAAIVLAHWQTRETRRDPESRRQWKLRIVKGLYRGNWSKEDVRQLFEVIDWMMTLPEPLEERFYLELLEFEKESNMPWLNSIERRGLCEGILEGIALDLEDKFGNPGRRLLAKVRKMHDPDSLRRFARFLKKAKGLDQLREFLETES